MPLGKIVVRPPRGHLRLGRWWQSIDLPEAEKLQDPSYVIDVWFLGTLAKGLDRQLGTISGTRRASSLVIRLSCHVRSCEPTYKIEDLTIGKGPIFLIPSSSSLICIAGHHNSPGCVFKISALTAGILGASRLWRECNALNGLK